LPHRPPRYVFAAARPHIMQFVHSIESDTLNAAEMISGEGEQS
jgi:hypothetical protein